MVMIANTEGNKLSTRQLAKVELLLSFMKIIIGDN